MAYRQEERVSGVSSRGESEWRIVRRGTSQKFGQQVRDESEIWAEVRDDFASLVKNRGQI